MFKTAAIISLPKQDLVRPPGALPILAAACEEVGCNYEIFDFNLWLYRNTIFDIWESIDANWHKHDPFSDKNELYYWVLEKKITEYVDKIIASNPDLIAISIFTDESAACGLMIINELNRRPARKQFKISIGGTGIRAKLEFLNDEFCIHLLKNNLIDYFIFGEGEIAFRKLLNAEFNYGGINNFNNVQIEDLNQFPFPSYKKINPRDYQFIDQPELIITGSKGCVRKCTYCDVAKYWPKFKYRSGKLIAQEMYHYHKTLGISRFEFSDSLINGSLKVYKEMNLELIKLQDQDPTFSPSYKGQYICRPSNAMKEQDYANMKAAGCNYLYVGVETFSNKVRQDMLKKFSNADLDHHLVMCAKYRIPNVFLMFVGYPTETLADHEENIANLYKYQKYAQAGIISMITWGYLCNILDNTPLFDLRENLGIVDEYADLMSSANWVSVKNPTLTFKERVRRWVELVELSNDLGYLQPRLKSHILRHEQMLDIMQSKPKKFLLAEIKN